MAVLITAGLSQEAYRLQRVLDLQDAVFADEQNMPAIPGRKWITIVPYHSISFAHEMLKTCLDNDIDTVYPLKREEVTELSRASQLFSEFDIRLMVPSGAWLDENQYNNFPASGFFVLQNGAYAGGTIPEEQISLFNETGIFTRATIEGKMMYSLYVA